MHGANSSLVAIIAAVLVAVVSVSVAWSKKVPAIKYAAAVYSNPSRDECTTDLGIVTELHARLGQHLPLKQLRSLATANKPDRPAIMTAGKTYHLSVDPSRSFYGYAQIVWTFRPVKVGPTDAKALIGKKVKLTYRIGHTSRAATVRVQDGRC